MPESVPTPELRPCNNCGKCCTNPSYMGSLTATKEDVKRWRREKRHDILRFVAVLGDVGAQMPFGGYADLWVDENGNERSRCPFVRKVRGSPRHLCTIYETRPQVCRDYVPWGPHSICEELPDTDV